MASPDHSNIKIELKTETECINIDRFPAESARWNEEMNEGATKRLGAMTALRGLSASKSGCARISMLVRSKNLLH
jgi:hypothetical protein